MRKKTSEPIKLYVRMTLKKPFPKNKPGYLISRDTIRIIRGIHKDYPGIVVDYVHSAVNVSDTIECCLLIDRKFARENLYFNGVFDPGRYMSFYLSRVARRLKKSNKWLARYFYTPGMFDYEYLMDRWYGKGRTKRCRV